MNHIQTLLPSTPRYQQRILLLMKCNGTSIFTALILFARHLAPLNQLDLAKFPPRLPELCKDSLTLGLIQIPPKLVASHHLAHTDF